MVEGKIFLLGLVESGAFLWGCFLLGLLDLSGVLASKVSFIIVIVAVLPITVLLARNEIWVLEFEDFS